ALNVSKVLGKAFDRPIPQDLFNMVEAKKLGKKTGQGFYKWESGKPIKNAASNEEKTNLSDDIEDRLILPMLNEAAACLDEKIVSNADMLDIGVIFGTGFAPFRGGPIMYAKNRGIKNIIASLKDLVQKYGSRFKPNKAWSSLN
ncbi:MAG TPA: 3-hydroxyacyl-CoA dehydrogenase, partial [Woeseiaceae bacterium]|nr:3-hydroxyacyl-CoA dehydrogenase [Woeseiaceae bacterium]